MNINDQFIQKSINERIILRKIFSKMSNFYDWKYILTDETSYDLYDARLMKFKKDTGEILENYYVEEKIRDVHYDELMLEEIKYKNLIGLAKKLDDKMNKECMTMIKSKVLYISTTPKGSFLFNLSEIDFDKVEWQIKTLPVSTVNRSAGKIEKKVCFLPIKLAKFITITSNDIVQNDDKIIKKVMINQTQNKCIFFGM